MAAGALSRLGKIDRKLLPVLLWGVLILSAAVLIQRRLSGDTLEHQREMDEEAKQRQAVAQSGQASPATIAAQFDRQAAEARGLQGGAPAPQTDSGSPAASGTASAAPKPWPGTLAPSGPSAPRPAASGVPLRMPEGAPATASASAPESEDFGPEGGPRLTYQQRVRNQARASEIAAYEESADARPAAPPNPVNALIEQMRTSNSGSPPGSQALLEYARKLQAGSPGSAPRVPGPGASDGGAEAWLAAQGRAEAPGTDEDRPLRPKAAASHYLLFEGTPIRVALLQDINSDLPGTFTAMVTRDVYDSVSGQHLLISQGTQMRGLYNSEVVAGQNRLLFAFSRMIFHNGASVRLRGMPGSDLGGASGAQAEVDNHFWEVFGSSLAVGAVALYAGTRGGAQSTNVTINVGGSGNAGQVLASQVLSDVVKQMLARNQNMKRTLSLKKGEELTVVINRDMELPPEITGVRMN